MPRVLTGRPEFFNLKAGEILELRDIHPVDKFFKMKFKYDQEYGWNQVPTSDKVNIFQEGGFREALEACSGNFWNDYLNNTCFYDSLTHSVMNKTDVTDFVYRYVEYWLTSREKAVKEGFVSEWDKFSFDPSGIPEALSHIATHFSELLANHGDLLLGTLDMIVTLLGMILL